ncbi:DUF6586 family protein [Marinobacter halophilus]|uniref:Uncharacterized protein n=1 Tax=Marinobacter halophilus TaxID=1323740 RepID=A0A2T1KA62_9GAMM|nr:DUF6586 family protein [Marinobacter halophilus]PSF07016.1 hypothetical protein C7H08_17020 [Marinobacter halophilus]GGC75536.1 hypothetical protein GCM10011362_25100 [Marinobacter halophilus]
MASQWYSLVSQKLFLASTLLTRLESDGGNENTSRNPAADKEALSQGATELLLRARKLLLIMIARCHQHKAGKPDSLTELEALFPYEVHEVQLLKALSDTAGSWWHHLDQLEEALSQPHVTRKNVTTENIIAISVEQGPDRSPAALKHTLAAITRLARSIEDQHGEW